MSKVTYYHYINKNGLDGIKKNRAIKPSMKLDSGDDAVHGDGVYFTNKPPSAGKQAIAELCWNNVAQQAIQDGKLDYVIIVNFPEALDDAKKRGVFLYTGGVLNLDNYDWEVAEVP